MKRIISAVLLLASIVPFISCKSTPTASAGNSDAVSGASPAGDAMPSVLSDIEPVSGGGRILVVYFSQGNATRRVAEDIAAVLGADLERIVELKPRSSGFFGFMKAGADSSMGKATKIVAPIADVGTYDAVVVCTPVWAWHLSPPVRSWLRIVADRLPPCAFVVVSGNTDPEKIVAMMEKESGKKAIGVAGFVEEDFKADKRAIYLEKIRALSALYRR